MNYLETGKTKSGHYCNLFDRLDINIRAKRPGLQKKRITFHKDNAASQTAQKRIAKMGEIELEMLLFRRDRRVTFLNREFGDD